MSRGERDPEQAKEIIRQAFLGAASNGWWPGRVNNVGRLVERLKEACSKIEKDVIDGLEEKDELKKLRTKVEEEIRSGSIDN